MKKSLGIILIIGTIAWLLVGCGGGAAETQNSVDLAVTQTLDALAQQAMTEATAVPQEEPQAEEPALPDDYPTKDACEQMAGWMSQFLTLPAEISLNTFDGNAGLSGDGCTVLVESDGAIADIWSSSITNLHGHVLANGWEEDMYFMAAGATGMLTTYRSPVGVCQMLTEARPVNTDNCPDDAPIGECMESLPPEELNFKVEVNCSPDMMTNLSGMGPEFSTQEIVVEFNPGETFQVVPGDLTPQIALRFVLRASEGQTMEVRATTEPAGMAVISVWGQDGMLYLSGLEGRAEWSMLLPKDQLYYVDIKNIGDQDITYQIIFDIP